MTKDEALEKIEQYTKKHATARIRLLKELIDNDNISRRLVTDKLNISDSTIKSMEIQGDIVVNAWILIIEIPLLLPVSRSMTLFLIMTKMCCGRNKKNHEF